MDLLNDSPRGIEQMLLDTGFSDLDKDVPSRRRRSKNCCSSCCMWTILAIAIVTMAYGLTETTLYFLTREHDTPPTTTTSSPTTTTLKNSGTCEKRIIGYFRLGEKSELTEKQISLLTHIIFYKFNIQENGTLAIGKPEEKKNSQDLTLVDSISSIIKEYHMDGVDIFWKWPSNEQEYSKLILLCTELRERFSQLAQATKRKSPFLISLILSPWPKHDTYRRIQDKITALVDFLNVETNNYYGSWFSEAGHFIGPPAALYSGHEYHGGENVNYAMWYHSCRTGNPNKLNIGLSFRVNYWENVILPQNKSDTLWLKAEKINGTVRGGWLSWRNFEKKGWNLPSASWNQESRTPYFWEPDQRRYIAFENERSIQEKINYAIDKNIGGFTIWALNDDDDDHSLSKAVGSANLCSRKGDNSIVNYNCTGV
ncbi:hypothetical protein CAEBREN_29949 [Caenorhabditis brenneri]|uniref:GH18 domain-containing protein n=1 Tax=Caenorhabditis brenneri TaxID=135651 RepID=G0PLV5_CAEBE|nr:hypothetical protein CAEBREN_29949 [Caenorhabditis brenneri]